MKYRFQKTTPPLRAGGGLPNPNRRRYRLKGRNRIGNAKSPLPDPIEQIRLFEEEVLPPGRK